MMNRKQFKESLLRGQGRCILATQADPERYRDVVLWACGQELAFDSQSDGTRSWFIYRLICCYPDKKPFLDAIIQSFDRAKPDRGWKLICLAERLKYFSDEGETAAEQALWRKYEALYAQLLARKSLSGGLFPLRDNFSMLCDILAEDLDAHIRIVEDLGRLFREKSLYDGFDFIWLYHNGHSGALKKLAGKSENIAAYLREGERCRQKQAAGDHTPRIPQRGPALSLWLAQNGSEEMLADYAGKYLNQTDPDRRAEALAAFSRCPYPGDPSPIIRDTDSDNAALREAAWYALENIRHPLVREFALQNLDSDMTDVLPVFIRNVRDEDAALLEGLVKQIPVGPDDESGWHRIYIHVLNMAKKGLKAPPGLLTHIYEHSYCSYCRNRALRQLGKRRLLTEEMLQECLFDSNEEIRRYAAQRLKRRAENTP
ncbi:MAG: hypothetical protein MSO56_11565 [Clostridiales bacterium]|nr:hypothetical protein [Clostridiales bacterium]